MTRRWNLVTAAVYERSAVPDRRIIEQPEPYRPLHLWTDVQGNRWACCTYDHGLHCRLCQPVDDLLADILQNVVDGYMLVKADANGEMTFKMTAKGTARAEDLIGTDPEMAMLWAQLEANRNG